MVLLHKLTGLNQSHLQDIGYKNCKTLLLLEVHDYEYKTIEIS